MPLGGIEDKSQASRARDSILNGSDLIIMVKHTQVRTLEQEYEVESIQDKKMHSGKVHYLVKWRGFNDSESTWEPIDHMEGSMDLVEQYENAHGKTLKVAKKGVLVQNSKPRKAVIQKQSVSPALEIEDWNVIEDQDLKPKRIRRLVKKQKPTQGSFLTDQVEDVIQGIKDGGKTSFEVSWKERDGFKPINSVVSLEEFAEKEPKVLISFLVQSLGMQS